jgi:hypothetical protein
MINQDALMKANLTFAAHAYLKPLVGFVRER